VKIVETKRGKMSRLNRELCSDLVAEFIDYEQSENDLEVNDEGKKFLRQFCEALVYDDAVRDRFDTLLRDADKQNGNGSRRGSREAQPSDDRDGSKEQFESYMAGLKKQAGNKMLFGTPRLDWWQKLTPAERKRKLEEVGSSRRGESSGDTGWSPFKGREGGRSRD
jgi:hypothetical protein